MVGSRNGQLDDLDLVPAATPQMEPAFPTRSTACGCHERPKLLAGHRTSNLSTERPPLAWFPSHRLKVRSSFGPRSQSSGSAACPSIQLHLTTTSTSNTIFSSPQYTMTSTRKRKQDEEELVALPSDESEEEEE